MKTKKVKDVKEKLDMIKQSRPRIPVKRTAVFDSKKKYKRSRDKRVDEDR